MYDHFTVGYIMRILTLILKVIDIMMYIQVYFSHSRILISLICIFAQVRVNLIALEVVMFNRITAWIP
jgi:hypothetical protein